MSSTEQTRLIDQLQNDLRSICTEAKRKNGPVKDAAEAGLMRIKTIASKHNSDIQAGLLANATDASYPFIMACQSFQPRLVQLALPGLQRLISASCVTLSSADAIASVLLQLVEAHVEELRVLQTAALLVNSSGDTVRRETLAKIFVACFRMYFSKEPATSNTAAATIKQLVGVVFERVQTEDAAVAPASPAPAATPTSPAPGTPSSGSQPSKLRPAAADAYMLFQDFCLLVNGDSPAFLIGVTEMSRQFGLELIEQLLSSYPKVFLAHPELSALVKDRLCSVIIRLFSPNVQPNQNGQLGLAVSFSVLQRLLRILNALFKSFFQILTTESEIFLSMLARLCDNSEKPVAQRVLAVEVVVAIFRNPYLIRQIVVHYDMKNHSTKILSDLVSSVATFIQSCFLTIDNGGSTGTSTALVDSTIVSSVGTISSPFQQLVQQQPQSVFLYRGTSVPVLYLPTQLPTRPLMLDMADKAEGQPIGVPDGYGCTVAFCGILDLVSTVQALIDRTKTALPSDYQFSASSEAEESAINEAYISSTWCPVLQTLSLLLDSSSDESAAECILKAMEAMASLSGRIGPSLFKARDAFITALCKAALPPHYTLAILNTAAHAAMQSRQSVASLSSDGVLDMQHPHSAIVAVGNPLLCSNLVLGQQQQGPVALTVKNIQCMRCVLSLCHCHGAVLGTAWHLVLATLQHLCWILGLRSSVGGTLRADRPAISDVAGSASAQALSTDLPILAAMMSRLFESSQYLDDIALHHLLTALISLSHEAMDSAYTANREPSLFPVAKLLETGLVNLARFQVIWKPLTAHLLEICQHPNQNLRQYAVEAVVALVKAAVAFPHKPPLSENQKVVSLLLMPLIELSSTGNAASGNTAAASSHSDVRTRQLDCLLHIVQSHGGSLHKGVWNLVLGVIGDITGPQNNEILVRQSFRCLQIVTTDHLSSLNYNGLTQCIDTVTKFCAQQTELNTSLSAIGLLWGICDHIAQNSVALSAELVQSDTTDSDVATQEKTPSAYPLVDALWMRIYKKLADLCLDNRPPLRKSAAQTLFEALAMHADKLSAVTLSDLIWTIIFPLLESIREQYQSSSGGASLPTLETKHLAEAHIIVIAGSAGLFTTRQRHAPLAYIAGAADAWVILLDHLASLASNGVNSEVSHAAIRALVDLFSANSLSSSNKEIDAQTQKAIDLVDIGIARRSTIIQAQQLVSQKDGDKLDQKKAKPEQVPYENAWPAWAYVAKALTTSATSSPTAKTDVPSQPKLSDLVKAFRHLITSSKVVARFTEADIRTMGDCLGGIIAAPVLAEAAPFVLPLNYEPIMTQLQTAVISVLQAFQDAFVTPAADSPLIAQYIYVLLALGDMAVNSPSFPWQPHASFALDQLPPIPVHHQRNFPAGILPTNVVPFGERCLQMATALFASPGVASNSSIVKGRVLQRFLRSHRGPLRLKYACPARTTWLVAFDSLMTVLQAGLPLAREQASSPDYIQVWPELGGCCEDFLFCKQPPPSNLSLDELARDETCDCRLVDLIQNDLLPQAMVAGSPVAMPREFVLQIMHILNKGSVHSTSSEAFIDLRTSRHLRLEFAKRCFDTLLRFSCLQSPSVVGGQPVVSSGATAPNTIALLALLDRCRSVIVNFAKDCRLSGELPLPRSRSDETMLVLKSLAILVDWLVKESNKQTPGGNKPQQLVHISPDIWTRVIDLYPDLVQCTQVSNTTVAAAVLDVLVQYKCLLRPPTSASLQQNP